MPAPATVTLTGVELVRAGSWLASTGPVTIATSDLDAIVAAYADPEVDRAAIRIGHVDPRYDGEPALGWVENLRRNGDALIGDLVEVPAMLAELIPRAFRRRSVEIAWQVRTAAGRQYRAALTGLALLGVAAPAVKGLADVARLYGRTAASASSTVYTGAAAGPDATSADHVTGVAVDDPTGPVLDNRDAIRAALGAMTAALSALDAELDTIPAPTITDNPAPTGQNDGTAPQEDPMPGSISDDRIRELLGLEEAADLEAELERIAAERASGDDDKPADDDEADGGDTTTEVTTPGGTEVVETTPAQDRSPELVTLSAGNLDELRRQAADGAAARAILAQQERDGILRTALSAGRIAPADADAWRTRLEADQAGTTSLLSSLTPAFPTSELGSDKGTPQEADEAAFDEFDRAVFGIEK